LRDPRAVAVTPSGGLVVLEHRDQQIHFLDATGKAVRTTGRKGGGPGEYQGANGLVVLPNGQIVVNDPGGNQRLTLLSPTGDFVRSATLQAWGFGIVWDAYVTPAGLVNEYVVVRPAGSTERIEARRTWSPDFASADTLMPARCPEDPATPVLFYRYTYPNGRGYMDARYPFVAPREESVAMSNGARWTGRHPDYDVIERRDFGRCGVQATIRLAGAPVSVPRATHDSAVAMIRGMSSGQGPDGPDPSKVRRALPGFEGVFADASNRVWVARFTGTNLRFLNNVPLGDLRFEVFDASGRPVAVVESPVRFVIDRPVTITNDTVYGFTLDEDDVFYLVAMRIQRN
jgi:hypothetical protein